MFPVKNIPESYKKCSLKIREYGSQNMDGILDIMKLKVKSLKCIKCTYLSAVGLDLMSSKIKLYTL